MKLLSYFCKAVFSSGDTSILKDIRLWLVLIVINTGANLGFNYLFPEKPVLLFLFALLVLLFISKKKSLGRNKVLYICGFIFIFLLQALYLLIFSVNTTLHYVLMISVAVMIVSLCGGKFPLFFSGIVFVYAVISLVCFVYMSVGGSIPYYAIQDTTIDGGEIMRVYNLYYTQLGNPSVGLVYGARNCGPFWEPGAFQGFLNISLWFEFTLDRKRDLYWKVRVIVLIITILTTLSTGGYMALFVVLFFYAIGDKKTSTFWKTVSTVAILIVSFYLYTSLDFLGDKIATDKGRMSFSFTDFPNLMYAIAGYGYARESFLASSLSSASSVFNLVRYLGVLGFIAYMLPLFFNNTYRRTAFFVIVIVILMNEPFLSCSLIWWGMPFIYYKAITKEAWKH